MNFESQDGGQTPTHGQVFLYTYRKERFLLACYKSMLPPTHGQLVKALLGYLDNHKLLTASLQINSHIVVQIGANTFYLHFLPRAENPGEVKELWAGTFTMITNTGSLAHKHLYAESWGQEDSICQPNGRLLKEKWNMDVFLPTRAAISVVNANHDRLPCDALRGLSPAPRTVWDQSIQMTQTWLAAGRKSSYDSYDIEVCWWLQWLNGYEGYVG